MKSFLKCLATGIAVVLVFCIIITTVLLRSGQEVKANESFEGINNIIEGNSEGNPYTIYELVPDASMGEIGYMIDGQEPIDWKSQLREIPGSSSRKDYINTELRSLYASICAEDTSRPLTYKPYDESYLAKDGWESYTLSNPDIIPEGTSGYGMIENIGAGDYTLSCTYYVNETQTGMYDQNVLYYQYASTGGYYGLKFTPTAPVVDAETGRLVPKDADGNDIILYKVSETSPIITQEIFDSVATNTPNAYVYRVSRDNLLGALDLVGRIGDDTVDFANFDANYIYYTVHFEYVGENPELSEDTVYYTASVNEFYNDKKGEYSGILNPAEPYVSASIQNEDNTVIGTGHFDMDASQTHYEYVGDGNGQYDLRIGNASDSLIEPLHLSVVYYTGGFTNNSWFKYGVFNQDGLLSDTSREMYFKVETLVPEQFNSYSINSCDMLYISANAFHNNTDNTASAFRSFGQDNDISWQQLCNIMALVQSGNHFPVVVDYSILGNSVNDLAHATNLQKLVALLCSADAFGITFTQDTTADTINWSEISAGINTDADHHFVNKNIYVYPGNSDSQSPYMMLDNSTGTAQYFTTPFIEYSRTFNDVTAFETEAEAAGFGEIAERIDSQNLSRRTENEALGEEAYGYFDLKISRAIAMEYIISYTDEDTQTEVSDSLSILDIEPCYVTDSTRDALQKSTVESWFAGRDVPEISITHMSTAEFIGNIVDISTYDMVYIGMSVNMLNTSNGNTVYNDTRMNGLIYVNIGDIAVLSTDHTGMLETDYTHNGSNRTGVVGLNDNNKTWQPVDVYANANNTYRYAGNDITKEKMEDIREYVYAGYPLIVADKFYNNPSEMDSVDQHYVDNCSYMYELFNGSYDENGNLVTNGLNSYNNVMTVKQVGENFRNLYNYLSLGKPKINLVEQTVVPNTQYVQLNTNTITLDFSISNSGSADANATFNPILYLDSNADGKFSTTQEGISATDVRVYDNGTLIRPTTTTDDDGETHSEYRLLAGSEHSYKFSYTLPENYVGIIPWRLKVSQSSNAYRYDIKGGYFYYRQANTEPTPINILQIGSTSGENFNMKNEANNPNSVFARALAQVTDYRITIEYMNSDAFGNLCYGKDVKYFENTYDMIVMGFADMYKINNRNNSVQIIKEYINRGNPILFTHDATSFCNNSTNHGQWGYDFNREIRNIVGMDRYGVLESEAIKVGLQLEKGSTTTTNVAGTNYVSGELYNQAVQYAKENNTDLAYLPGSNKNIIVKQCQGDCSGDMLRYAGGSYNKYYYWKNGRENYEMNTTKVDKVNSGQITTYPFILPDSFTVARTHAQYYQIDMNEDGDNDGESDIVVWYTLNNDSSHPNNIYGKSPKDVRNNYYIYTKGNVTYSGVGHGSGINTNENEVKLYINTMIAAYRAGTHAPSIVIKNSDEEDADVLNTIYETFDQSVDESGVVTSDTESVEQQVSQENDGTDAVEKIYFTVTDTNIVRNLKRKEIRVDFCIPVDETEYDSSNSQYTIVNDNSGNPIYLKKVDVNRYRKNAEGNYEPILTYYTSGVTYRADIPLSLLSSNSNYVEVYAVAQTTIIRNNNDGTEGDPTNTSTSYTTVRIQKVGLTDLD